MRRRLSYPDRYGYGYGDSDGYGYSYSYAERNRDSHSDTNDLADAKAYSYSERYSNAKASPDSTSSAVRLCVRLKEFIAAGGDRRLITSAAPEFFSNRGQRRQRRFFQTGPNRLPNLWRFLRV